MSNYEVMKAFEIVSVILYVAALMWVLRSRNPFWLGLLIGATTVYGFDWHWSTKGFFNATFNPDLIPTPGLTNQGVTEPWSILLNYGFGFGPAIILLLMATPTFDRVFGKAQYLVAFLCGSIGVAVYEIPVVHILHAWTYHQKPEYLFYGFPLSNFFLAGNMIMWPYLFARCLRDWIPMPDKPGCSLSSATTWKGIVMGVLPMWSGFYVAGLIQLFWYANTNTWIEVGRPF
jgi:hypothetical protein